MSAFERLMKLTSRITKRAVIGICFGCLLISAILLFGGVVDRQYRATTSPGLRPGALSGPLNPSIEDNQDYTLGFVEIDDQGWLWDRGQIDSLTNRFEAELRTNGLLIVTFVHGWMHNASADDANVDAFRKKMLRPLATMEEFISKKEHRSARRVVGVYVGWRGLSLSIPYLNKATFWERKSAAERIGHGALIELLCELEKLRNESNRQYEHQIELHNRRRTQLLIIGHSFGGDVVYSAVAPILIERMVENVGSAGQQEAPKTMGDLVVLINPAFEAARFETLQRVAATTDFLPGKSCTLAIFTSKQDLATKIAFPAGRTVSTIFETHRNKEQLEANRTAIGHYDQYITFDLVKQDQTDGDSERKSGERVLQLQDQMKSDRESTGVNTTQSTYNFTHCRLQPRTNCLRKDPVFVVSVDPQIIPDHGSIDRGVFTRFLAEFLALFSETSD
jgi:hypothetical protein